MTDEANGHRARFIAVERRVDDLKTDNNKEHGELWSALQRVRDRLDRPPVWMMLLFSTLTAVAGFLARAAMS